ncbi:MAG TPA: alkaline phosphatase family protein [Solirubrobacteraceae bacterium]|nr:alkaline phosphatase family protein [Solirubrobacteraceae bacterium]
MKRVLTALAAAAMLTLAIPMAATADPVEGVPAFGHVFVIIGENTELGQINKSNAPFLLNQVKPNSAWLTNYFAVTHFSEANYSAMTSGQYTSCQQFDGSIASCHLDVENIFHQLDNAGVPWQSWMESMPAPCYVVSAGSAKTLNHFGAKHNPAVFYDNVEGLGGVWSADPSGQSTECQTQDIPAGGIGPNDMSTFNHAVATGNVGRFNFIVPNECEDGHDNCKPQGNGVAQFDAFLGKEVPLIENSPEFLLDPNAVLIITFDEGTSNQGPGSSKQFDGGGNVAFAVVGPHVRTGTDSNSYNHYSFLRTLEDGFGITSYAGNAATASPINTIWQ